MDNLIRELKKNGITFKTEEPMCLHTTFKTGGPAKLFIIPENTEEIFKLISLCKENNTDIFVLGNGSNLLVSDEGIRDKAVVYIGSDFDYIRAVDDNSFEVGAGASLASVCKYALSHSLTGLEFAYGIPGSVGGAVVMNAGAYGGEMKDVIKRVNHISLDGETGYFEGDELDLSYRHSAYSDGGYIVMSVVISLSQGEMTEIESTMKDIISRRKSKQPLEYPSAGSVFKRPEGYFAGALIEQSGLKGYRIGGAMVSEKHAGFIINYSSATSEDVSELIKHCKKTVKEKFSVDLETEIKFI